MRIGRCNGGRRAGWLVEDGNESVCVCMCVVCGERVCVVETNKVGSSWQVVSSQTCTITPGTGVPASSVTVAKGYRDRFFRFALPDYIFVEFLYRRSRG